MKFATLVSISYTLLTAVIAELAPLIQSKNAIKGQYFVNLKRNTHVNLETHIRSVERLLAGLGGSNEIIYVYSALGRSYSAKLSDFVLEKIRNLPEVAYVEADSMAKLNVEQNDTTWSLNRISQRAKVSTSGPYKYTYNADGSDVAVYIIDTGILTTHPEFEGRAVHGASFPPGVETDDNGHGTHCAGIVGSKTFGVAKKASLIGVKAIPKSGTASWNHVVAGINWAASDKRGIKGNVVSISLGSGKVQTLNDAITDIYNKGFVAVVSAGNDNLDTCTRSPGSTPEAITVASSDYHDVRAPNSNWGKCVHVFAPGVSIESTWKNGRTRILSGTSMACPHVAGLAAYYLSVEPLTNAQIKQKIISTSTLNAISDPGTETPNRLVFNNVQ